ncbi:hypothetical protein HAX54_002572, partial [Datura stramonium]|nr:hypothetical protein [Datura stramonium]
EQIAEIKRLHRKCRLTQHQLDRLHLDTFNEWFKEKVKELEDTSNIPKDVQFLSKGPTYIARRFKEFNSSSTEQGKEKPSLCRRIHQKLFVPSTLEERKVCGLTLLKDIWKLPPGKTIVVPFNSCNQAIGKMVASLQAF